jgi:hypothetical protein
MGFRRAARCMFPTVDRLLSLTPLLPSHLSPFRPLQGTAFTSQRVPCELFTPRVLNVVNINPLSLCTPYQAPFISRFHSSLLKQIFPETKPPIRPLIAPLPPSRALSIHHSHTSTHHHWRLLIP